MSTPTKDILYWSAGALTLGFGLAWLFGFMTCEKCPPATAPSLEMIAYYDRTQLGEMLEPSDAKGIRFYLARNDAGALTCVAGPFKDDGAHIADGSGALRFRMFKGVSGEVTDMTMLDEHDAVDATLAAGTTDKPTWSIDATHEAIRALLDVEGCTAIGIVERSTTGMDWTFDVVPVMIEDGAFRPVGDLPDMRVGAPCPMHCPREPGYYLHRKD